jgi:hypothetical protein
MKLMSRQSNLPKIAGTLSSTGSFACRLNSRKQQSGQHPDDGNDDQELDKRKTV